MIGSLVPRAAWSVSRRARWCAGLCALACLTTGPAGAASVFVASQSGAEVARIEPGATQAAARIPVERGPAGVAADAHGHLYLTHPDHRMISVVDTAGGTVLRRLTYQGQAFGIAADPEGRYLVVGDWSRAQVSRISPETGAVEGTVAVGRDPANLVLDRAGRAYVADRESHQVSVIDLARMERIAVVPVGTAPFALGLSPRQDRLYVANVRSNDLSVIDTASLTRVATVPVGPMPYGVAVTPDGTRVLVTNQHAGTVTVLDSASLTVAATVPVGQYPEGIVAADGQAFVANWFSDDVSVIDLASLRETARVAVGEGPRNLCLDAREAAR